MQTFLPYPSFEESARALDYRRLGKQRVEAKQIVQNLIGENTGWIHHPAVKMWEGYSEALILYGMVVCSEWLSRGYKDTLLHWFASKSKSKEIDIIYYPLWLGDTSFHDSHKSNLRRKDEAFYGPKWPHISSTLPYVWPKPFKIKGE